MKTINNIFQSLIEPFTRPETYEKLITQLIMVAIYIVVGMIIIRIVNKAVVKGFDIHGRKKGVGKRSKTLVSLIQNIVSYVIWFIIFTTILSRFGVHVESILAGAGVVGLAVGFGAQTLVKDVITGFFIIFENQFDVGDYVKINNGGATISEGTVQSIGLRSTRIQAMTGERYVIPNGSMGEIINFSVDNGKAIVEIPIATTEDISKVEAMLQEFLQTLRPRYYVFGESLEVLGVEAINANEVRLKIAAETTPGETFTGARILRKEILGFFRREGIQVPRPSMVQFNAQTQKKA